MATGAPADAGAQGVMTTADLPAVPVRPGWLARACLRLAGWRLEGSAPTVPKYVLIGAPHTSNWDFVLALLVKSALGIRFCWIGKDSLFRFPFGGFMRWLGGIPVNRRVRSNFTEQMVARFCAHRELSVVITPEGTRSRTEYWKSGFYHVALGAGVPVVLGFVDYRCRRLGIGPVITLTGDREADMKVIREFYADKSGLHPEKQGQIRLRSRS